MVRYVVRLWWLAALVLALPLLAAAGTRVALVIGNNAYQYGGVLNNAVSDARKIGDALKRLGFQVIRKQDLSYSDLLGALDELGKEAVDADWAVVYYAGHAVQVDGKNHLVPVDVALNREGDLRRTVELDDLLTEVNQGRELGLVILDACRDNPFTARLNQGQGRSLAGRGLARVGTTGGNNTLVAFATRENNIAADSGVYATVLAEYLETPGLDVRQLFGKVRDAVMERTRNSQQPYIYGSLGGGSYAFKPVQTPPPTPLPVPPAENSNALELAFWNSIKDSRNAADFSAYLKRYPQGVFADLAQNRLATLTERPKPSASTASPSPRPTSILINGRYRDNGDGTVTDVETHLQWMRCALGQAWNNGSCTGRSGLYKWQEALNAAKGFNYAGYTDWRVPSREELRDLVYCSSGRFELRDKGMRTRWCEGDYFSPTIDTAAFPNTPASYFWSASPVAGYSDYAWGVYFGNGYDYGDLRRYAYHVRLVRAGQ